MLLALRIGPSKYPQAGGYDSYTRLSLSDVLLSTPPFAGFSRAARQPSSRAQAEGSSRRSLASGAFLTGLKIEFFNTLIYA